MSHRYQVNDMVRLVRPRFADGQSSATSIFEITRLMPEDQSGDPSYRAKSSGTGECVVRESEIAAKADESKRVT